jgi:hypothetical protein
VENTVTILNPNRGWGVCALLAIAMACGLIATPSAAKADTYSYVTYGGYYYYPAVQYDYVKITKTYVRPYAFDLYVANWYQTGTATEYLTDANGRTWRIVGNTYRVKRGYAFYGSYVYANRTYHQRLCGTLKICPYTGAITMECACGAVYGLDE